jgi:sulfonate transport system substrate-binding protein
MQSLSFRRSRALGAVVALGASASLAASGIASAAPRPAKSSPGFTLEFGFISTNGPSWVTPGGFAYSKGKLLSWLKPLGVRQIDFIPFANGPLLEAAVEGGSVQLGELGDTPALIGESDHIPERLVNQYEVGMDAWLVAQKGITSLSQLTGKTIATSAGSYMYRYLLGLIEAEHLGGKVTVTNLLPSAALPALESGSVAAVAEPPQTISSLVSAKGYPIVDKASQHSGLEGTGLTVGSNTFLAAHPGFAAKWNAVNAEAVKYADANQNAYYDFTAKAESLSVQNAKLASPLDEFPMAPFTTKGLTLLKGTLNFLNGQKLANEFSIPAWEATSS